MKKIIEQLTNMVKAIRLNEHLHVSYADIKPGYSKEELLEMGEGLDIKYSDDLLLFYSMVGEISLTWTADANKVSNIPADDIPNLTGSIQILNPFDMIMGKTGTRWKDVLWFEDMDDKTKNEIKSFAPFDFQSTELISGFKIEKGTLSKDMYNLASNAGIAATGFELEKYLNYLVQTKGFSYWQNIIPDKSSDEYARFITHMPALFPDFDTNFFNK
jgi:hypothetical protein